MQKKNPQKNNKYIKTRSIVVIMATFCQTELVVEICSESLVRAIGKVLLIKFS